ncbi:MAG: Gfo/Idh/MocA family oxidoreductase [bacterium]|nr:Gfo/Idh/MocA family oxidoreductase [bacterium]
MLKIGFVDLDTSHPGSWLKILKERNDVEVVACWDGGTVYEEGYAEKFARENGIPKVCKTLEEMVNLVDVAFIQSCNWDLHLERALPFINAGKGVFIDKPIVGNMKDLFRLLELERHGAKIIGGSSLRYAQEIESFKSEDRGDILSVFASTSNDSFNYGIHGIEMFQGLLGVGVHSVRYLGSNISDLFYIDYKNGIQVILQLKSPTHHFYMTVTTTKGIYTINVDSSKIYRPLLDKVISYFKDEEPFPFTLEELLESIKIALACRYSKIYGVRVFLEELPLDDPGFDGDRFAKEYRLLKLRTKK